MRVNEENKTADIEQRDMNYVLPAFIRNYLFLSKNVMPEKIVFPMFKSVRYGDIEVPIEFIPVTDPRAIDIAADGADIPEVTEEQEAALDEKDEEIKRLEAEVDGLRAAEALAVEKGLKAEETTSEQLLDEAADLQLEEETSPARAAFAEPVPGEEVTDGLTEEEQIYEAARADQPLPTDEEVASIEHDPKPPSPAPTIGDDATRRTAEFNDRIPKQPPGGDIGPGAGPSDMHPRDSRDQVRTARDLREEPDINEAEEKDFEQTVSRDAQGKPVVEDKPSE